ncbi:CHAP domain-containing protein [Pedosphaera parvula]|nr:CHAP domain-containing protein [Pedosphaera parvula]
MNYTRKAVPMGRSGQGTEASRNRNSVLFSFALRCRALWLGMVVAALMTVAGYSAHGQTATLIVHSNAWLGGLGVDIFNNAGVCCCGWGSSYTICPSSGQSVYTGCEWQCVEMPQRLYTVRGWHCGAWAVSSAYQLFNNPDVGTSYNNGSGYVPVSGDLLVWKSTLPNSGHAGHVAVVDYVDSYNVYICEQNSVATGRDIMSRSGVNGSSLSRSGWPDRYFYGVVHNTNNPFGNLAPPIPLWTWASQPINTNADGRLDLWGVGTDGSVYHNVQSTPNGGWNGWVTTGLSGVQSGVTVARNADGRLEAFARGSNNSIWHTYQSTPNGSWSAWADLVSPGMQGTPVVAVDIDGRLELCARGTNNIVYDNFQTTAGGSWYGWISLSGAITSDLAAAREQDGRAELYANGTGGAVYYNHQASPSGSWSGWVSLGAPAGGSQRVPVAAQNADGRLEVYTVDTNHVVWHNYETTANGAWNGWASLGGSISSRITAGHNLDGRIELYGVGTDGNVYHNYQSAPNGGWNGWVSLGAGAAIKAGDAVAVGNNADGRLDISIGSTTNAVWNNYEYPSANSTSWNGWGTLGGSISYLFK